MICSPCKGLQQRARLTIKSSTPRTTMASSPVISRFTARTPVRRRDSFCLSRASNFSGPRYFAITLRGTILPFQIAVAVAQHLFHRELKARGFLLEKLAPNLDRFGALLLGNPVTHSIARAPGSHKIQPVTRWV